MSTDAGPRGLEKERTQSFSLYNPQPKHTNTAPMAHAEPPTFSPHIVVILVKHVYGASGGA